jgi:3-oxoacyl-[acyl-carrier-protein] synthase II
VLFPIRKTPGAAPRVVITGAGVITALGIGWRANAEGFREGRRAFRPVTLFDVSKQRVHLAAEVDLPPALPSTPLPLKRERQLGRATRLLLWATHEAWEQANWDGTEPLPVVLGTTGGGMSSGEEYFRQAIQHPLDGCGQPTRAWQYVAANQGALLGEAFGFTGPVTVISTACASGANAIGYAWEMLRRGHTPRVLAGAYDELSLITFAGFDSLQALSPTSCRPFDAHRDGLALGEGAAILALETLESAQRRGASVLAEIIGYGTSLDLYHLTQPHPDGDAALRSMLLACTAAGILPSDVDYINAHGTGTLLNDSSEATAINRWAGDAPAPPVSSTKGGIGHLLGAAGAVEAVVCLMAMREQWLPPQSNLQTADPVCRFPLVTKPMVARVNVALSNSFGFGGSNATLVLRRWA